MKILGLSLLLIFSINCSRKVENTTIRFKLPDAEVLHSVNGQTTGANDSADWNSNLNPTQASALNCYAVFVAGPEDFMQRNSCSNSQTGEEVMRFGPHGGFFPAGSEVAIDVPSGEIRKITLVGLVGQNGACRNFRGTGEPDFQNLSYPIIVAETQVSLQPGVTIVPMTPVVNSGNESFDDCDIIDGDHNGNGPDGGYEGPMFGDGS